MVYNLPFDVILYIRQYLFQNLLFKDELFSPLIKKQTEVIKTRNCFLFTTRLLNRVKKHCRVIQIAKPETMVIRSKVFNKILSIIQNPAWQLILAIREAEHISTLFLKQYFFLTIFVKTIENPKWFNFCDFSRCSSFYLLCTYHFHFVPNPITSLQGLAFIESAFVNCAHVTDISCLSRVKNLAIINCQNIEYGLEHLTNVKFFTVDFNSMRNFREIAVYETLKFIPKVQIAVWTSSWRLPDAKHLSTSLIWYHSLLPIKYYSNVTIAIVQGYFSDEIGFDFDELPNLLVLQFHNRLQYNNIVPVKINFLSLPQLHKLSLSCCYFADDDFTGIIDSQSLRPITTQ
jgi:hypothetical protein